MGVMVFVFVVCGNFGQDVCDVLLVDVSYQDVLFEQLIDVQFGDVIEILVGVYYFIFLFMLIVDGVIICGVGMDEIIFNFQGQFVGVEGLLVIVNDFILENFVIEDIFGDVLKVYGGINVVICGVWVEWINGYFIDNGVYGIYLVQLENVLVEDIVVIGVLDVGIYVGQLCNVMVCNFCVEYNVVGIEIENCIGVDVYGNIVINNIGGIFVFNMFNLFQLGYQMCVYDNDVFENNIENFGYVGILVVSVLAGIGILINFNDYVEIFNNWILDNNMVNVIIFSLYIIGYVDSVVQFDFDVYLEGIWIYDNIYFGGGNFFDGLDFNVFKVMMFGLIGCLFDVFFDGYIDEVKFVDDEMFVEFCICVSDDVDVLNVDVFNGFSFLIVDIENYCCMLDLFFVSYFNWFDQDFVMICFFQFFVMVLLVWMFMVCGVDEWLDV